MPLSIRIILLIVLLLCSAFFSMTESAFSYCNQIRMKISADEGSKSAKLVLKCLDKFDNYIVTNLIGNNIVNNLFSAMSTTLCGLLLLSFMSAEEAKSWGSIITIVVGTLVVFFVGENIPKNIGKAFPNAVCKIAVYPLYVLGIILTPISWIFNGLLYIVKKIFKTNESEPLLDEEDFQDIVEKVDEIEEEEKAIIQSAVDFDEALMLIEAPDSSIANDNEQLAST